MVLFVFSHKIFIFKGSRQPKLLHVFGNSGGFDPYQVVSVNPCCSSEASSTRLFADPPALVKELLRRMTLHCQVTLRTKRSRVHRTLFKSFWEE